MAADDYAVAGGGALKLKGGKVQKSKKKKKSKTIVGRAISFERPCSAPMSPLPIHHDLVGWVGMG